MDGTYKDGEKHQEYILRIKFKVKHNPGNQSHLDALMKLNNHYIKGEDIYMEDGQATYDM